MRRDEDGDEKKRKMAKREEARMRGKRKAGRE